VAGSLAESSAMTGEWIPAFAGMTPAWGTTSDSYEGENRHSHESGNPGLQTVLAWMRCSSFPPSFPRKWEKWESRGYRTVTKQPAGYILGSKRNGILSGYLYVRGGVDSRFRGNDASWPN
jgi:hypothetical protein